MIRTQRITSVSSTVTKFENYHSINVLKWKNSKWKTLCPYYLKTDGNEVCENQGGVLFENFYQGLKVYNTVFSIDVYPSRYQQGNPKYLHWSYKTVTNTGDVLTKDKELINEELYLRWKNSLWCCEHPIRYPNGKNVPDFALLIKKDGNKSHADYITLRKEVYVNEYIRLIKNTDEYKELLDMHKRGENLLIAEIDVPLEDNCLMTLEKLDELMNDTTRSFGHGLCLAYALLNEK